MPQDSVQVPKNQKAWTIVRRGKPSDALFFDHDAAVPSKLAKGEVLVKVQAAALNPVGYKLMGLLPNFVAKRPQVAECDLAAVVVDANSTELEPGQEVFGFIDSNLGMKTGQGALAQFARLPADHLVSRPLNLTPTEAAGLTLTGITAYQALFDVAKLESGQSIFINGGSTSVGIFAIQYAKGIGCKVTASASGAKETLLKSLGVDEVIDYTKGLVHEQLEKNPPNPKFHVILEAVGNTDVLLYTHSEAYLAPSGMFVSVGPYPQGGIRGFASLMHYGLEIIRPRFAGGTKRAWKFILLKYKQEDLKRLAEFVADGKLKPVVDSVYAYEDVLQAYERIMSGRASGKVVVKVDPSVA